MKYFNNKLSEVIKNNPDLPIIVCSYNGDANYDYDSTVYFDLSVYVEELTFFNDEVWLDYDDVEDRIRDAFADEEKYANLSDDEFDKAVEDYIKENYIFKKYICIYAR